MDRFGDFPTSLFDRDDTVSTGYTDISDEHDMITVCIFCAAGNHQQHRRSTCSDGAGYWEAPLVSLYQQVGAVQFQISADKIVGWKRAN